MVCLKYTVTESSPSASTANISFHLQGSWIRSGTVLFGSDHAGPCSCQHAAKICERTSNTSYFESLAHSSASRETWHDVTSITCNRHLTPVASPWKRTFQIPLVLVAPSLLLPARESWQQSSLVYVTMVHSAFEMRLLTCQLRIQCSPQPQLHSHTVASWSVEWNETVCYDCYDWQTIKVFAWWYVLQAESTLYRNFEVFTYVKAMLARLGRHYIFCETKRCLFPCLYSP